MNVMWQTNPIRFTPKTLLLPLCLPSSLVVLVRIIPEIGIMCSNLLKEVRLKLNQLLKLLMKKIFIAIGI